MFWKKKLSPPSLKKTQYDYAEDVANYLPAVLSQGAGAEYVGGSIGFKLSAIRPLGEDEEDEYILVAAGDTKRPSVVLFWADLCYLNFMGKNPKNVAASTAACEWNKKQAINVVFKYFENKL